MCLVFTHGLCVEQFLLILDSFSPKNCRTLSPLTPHFRLFTIRFHYAYPFFILLFNVWISCLVIWSCTNRKELTCSNYNELRVEAYLLDASLQFFPESSSALCELACRHLSVNMVVILRFEGLLANTKRNINGPYVKHTFRHRPLAEGRCPRRRVPQSP